MNLIGCAIIFTVCCLAEYQAFIVIPEELPSILSIFFSNVPPIKKGTDSRVGIGFRLGPNADFQVQFELGPQTNTQPIGPSAGGNNTSKKRQTSVTSGSSSHSKATFNSTNPSEKWLNTWKMNLNEEENQRLNDPHEISDPTRENTSFVHQLRQLYKGANSTSTQR